MARRGKGEGSIYRDPRNKQWIGMLDLGWQDGRRVRKAIRGASRREVADKLARVRSDQQRGMTPPTDERTTVTTFLEGWVRDVRATVRPATFVCYEGHVRLHIVPRIGRLRLVDLSPAHVRAMLDHGQAGRSARSVQLTHAVLRRALNQALRDGLVARNVAALVDAPRVRRDEVQPFDPDEARAFLAAARGDRLEALYTVAIALGLRQGEALGLRWQDVDLEAGSLTVARTLHRTPRMLRSPEDAGRGTRYVLAEPKTARSRRTLTMPGVVVAALREHRRRQLQDRMLAGFRWQEQSLIFTTSIGTPLDGRNVSHRFASLTAAAGLRRIRFHDLRHSAATLMLAQGVAPRVIMETLGHSQIGMTMDLYAHVIPALQREAADRMDALFTEAIGNP